MSNEKVFDYVIIGAGSAGCVLANRLSANPKVSVCLLEAGKRDTNPLIHIPAGVAGAVGNKQLNWGYKSVPQEHLDGRQINFPRGRVLGGSSSINGMVYYRGHRQDFDDWADLGCKGWGYEDVLPYFKKSEANTAFTDEKYHGTKGEMAVSSYEKVNPLVDSFVQAAQELQYEKVSDFNGDNPEGFGARQANIRDGRRESTATGFLDPIASRANLHVITDTYVERIMLENKRATGVELIRNGQTEIIKANREVIVSAGSYASPAILMRSGIGPVDELKKHNIEVLHANEFVGANLQDHLVAPTQMRTNVPTSYGLSLQALPKLIWWGIQYFYARKGLLASNMFEATGMIRTNHALNAPDLQLIFMPAHRNLNGKPVPEGHGYGTLSVLLRPQSRGFVKLGGASSYDAPLIDPKFLSVETDYEPLLKGIEISRQIFTNPVFDNQKAYELLPGKDVQSRDELKAMIRQNAVTVHHPVGTCKMGVDKEAVVDLELKVIGIEGLRVVDASIMPLVVRGNTAAAIMMAAEKVSDIIINSNK